VDNREVSSSGITLKDLAWCAGIKDGLKFMAPNERLAKAYLDESKSSLDRAEKTLNDGDLLWATVVIYYAEYYALYSFLQRIGIKCGNHHCSILAVGKLLGHEKTETINRHKDKRINAQYYIRAGREDEVKLMLKDAKSFVSEFDELTSQLGTKEVDAYRTRLNGFIND